MLLFCPENSGMFCRVIHGKFWFLINLFNLLSNKIKFTQHPGTKYLNLRSSCFKRSQNNPIDNLRDINIVAQKVVLFYI